MSGWTDVAIAVGVLGLLYLVAIVYVIVRDVLDRVREYERLAGWHASLVCTVLPLVVLGMLAWRTHQAVPVWWSNLTLWQHAAAVAPLKPRPLVNVAGAQLEAGHTQAGLNALLQADRLARASHVPAYDRRLTRQTVEANLGAMLSGAAQRKVAEPPNCNDRALMIGTAGLPFCGDPL